MKPSVPRRTLFVTLFVCGWFPLLANAGEPPGYYASAQGLTGVALRNALHAIIDDHTTIPYSGGSFDTHDAIDLLQEDPSDPSRVVLLYSGYSVPKSSWPDYNREHLWPVSLGADSGPANRDLFHLWGCDADVNSIRGNQYFDDCVSGCDAPAEAPLCRYDGDAWEPRDLDKGDIARALFYMDVRYSGDASGETDLALGSSDPSAGCDCMASLETLIAWHTMDPPSAGEIERCDLIYDVIQHNRNPFVDHPEWVYDIWGGAPPTGGDPTSVWCNEIHYDNAGADAGEGVEVAGPAGMSLAGWHLVAYNGATGTNYATIALTGSLPTSGPGAAGGFGVRWFEIAGLQNGAPDAIALVDDQGDVVQFLGYEGAMTATDGSAAGMQSIDIGVSEDGLTAIGQSLQLIGTGSDSGDFSWSGPLAASPGAINAGQTFLGAGPNFIRGDCNDDGSVSIADALVALDYLFASGSVDCLESCDASDDDLVLINDPLAILGYLFSGESPPPAPFATCGTDTTLSGPGDLGCDTSTSCP